MSLIGASIGLTMTSPSKTSLSLSILVMCAALFHSSSAQVVPAKIDCEVTWSSNWTKCSADGSQILRYSVDQYPTRRSSLFLMGTAALYRVCSTRLRVHRAFFYLDSEVFGGPIPYSQVLPLRLFEYGKHLILL